MAISWSESFLLCYMRGKIDATKMRYVASHMIKLNLPYFLFKFLKRLARQRRTILHGYVTVLHPYYFDENHVYWYSDRTNPKRATHCDGDAIATL